MISAFFILPFAFPPNSPDNHSHDYAVHRPPEHREIARRIFETDQDAATLAECSHLALINPKH